MTQRPRLSIAIPTYNRPNELEILLRSIEPQVVGKTDLIEIIVSDNCSTMDIEQLVSGFQKRFAASIRYVRHEENTGPDANILFCFESARAPYVWIIGDDDVLLSGAIEAALQVMERDLDIIFFRAESFVGDYVEQRSALSAPLDVSFYSDSLKFARTLNIMITFISGCVVNKDRFLQLGYEDPKSFLGTNLVQLSWLLQLVKCGKRFARVNTPLLTSKAENSSGGYKILTVFGKNYHEVLDQVLGVESRLMRIFENGVLLHFMPHYCLRLRVLSPKEFGGSMGIPVIQSIYRRNVRYWLFVYPVSFWRLRFAKVAFVMIETLAKIDGKLAGVLL